MLYKYCESIKTFNPWRNAHSPYSETVLLNEPSGLAWGCDVTTIQSLVDVPLNSFSWHSESPACSDAVKTATTQMRTYLPTLAIFPGDSRFFIALSRFPPRVTILTYFSPIYGKFSHFFPFRYLILFLELNSVYNPYCFHPDDNRATPTVVSRRKRAIYACDTAQFELMFKLRSPQREQSWALLDAAESRHGAVQTVRNNRFQIAVVPLSRCFWKELQWVREGERNGEY